jgi:hypothetical protein
MSSKSGKFCNQLNPKIKYLLEKLIFINYFWGRLIFVILIVILSTYGSYLLWEKVSLSPFVKEENFQAQYFQACWSICGLIISIFVFVVITVNSKIQTLLAIILTMIMTVGVTLAIVALLVAYFICESKQNFIRATCVSDFLINYLPVGVSFIVLGFDFVIVLKAQLEKQMKCLEKWQILSSSKILQFDIAIFFGAIAIVAITNVDFIELQYRMSFSGGASAFQLILATILFDPSMYLEVPIPSRQIQPPDSPN